MPKRHRPGHVSRRELDTHLAEIDELINGKQWIQARDRLQELDRRFPNNAELLSELLNVSYELHDMRTYLDVCGRLLKLDPDDADLTLALAGAYMANVRPASALATFRRFLQQWPDHERAPQVRRELAELDVRMGETLRDLGVAGDAGLEIAMLHEKVLGLLEQGKYRELRETAHQLLERKPDFAPALNNIAQSFFAEGNTVQAIATAGQVLAQHPDNFHALANLVHYHTVMGDFDQARSYAERLKSVKSEAVDIFVRKAEAAAYLGDDQAVLDAFQRAERAGHNKSPLGNPLLFHLAAAAHLRLGNERSARNLWQRALDVAPGFGPAKANLDDLRNPVGERHAPWFFEQGNLITARLAEDLATMLKRATRKREGALNAAMRQFVQQHPEFNALANVLFDRGDARSRELALQIAKLAQTPELLAALRDFGLSQRGPDSMRHTALHVVSEAGLIPDGPVRMWSRGSWQEVMLVDFEIDNEPTFTHSPQVETWLADSIRAEEGREIDRAEALLHRALAAEPESPDLLNNLATIYGLRGQHEQAETLLRQLLDKYPDYSFPRINLAHKCIQRGDLEQAEALLNPLKTRKRFSASEFGYYCDARIELLVAQHQTDGARQWLELWQAIDPENSLIADWQRRLSRQPVLARLLGRV